MARIPGKKPAYLWAGVLALAGALVVLPAGVSFARGGGGHGPGGGGFGGNFGGDSSGHTSTRALPDTNGPNSTDRDFGRDRAEDRMNQQGLEHNNMLNDNDDNGEQHGKRSSSPGHNK